MTSLIIVESPAKAKTIKKYLHNQYEVLASYGHVRDLEPKKHAVNPDDHFAMKYILIERNQRHVEAILKASKRASSVYLATDPDREGEAIAWHVAELIREKYQKKDIQRVVFHEITSKAVQAAMQSPRMIAHPLVEAQQTRRALDFLVGFELSPVLWKKLKRGLSAGRVQSPALSLIVEREQEIESFQCKDYWSIHAMHTHQALSFVSTLAICKGTPLGEHDIDHADQSARMLDELNQSMSLTVIHLESQKRERKPRAPLITSTLQQEAARRFGFSAKLTMQIAQQLYEGIAIGSETTGLITYMRTDSTHLAQEAVQSIRNYIQSTWGMNQVPLQPHRWSKKSKNAQEAHEAIRPTDITRTPEQMASVLNDRQLKIYQLIWKRTLASQMKSADIQQTHVKLSHVHDYQFKATGSVILDPGFLIMENKIEEDVLLPSFQIGDVIKVDRFEDQKHTTMPPARYSEASLIKALESFGIGRPSTYAPIIATLQDRHYVVIEDKRFYSTDMGRMVHQFLKAHFSDYIAYDFTAKLEDQLDAIARGEMERLPVLSSFWNPFSSHIQKVSDEVPRMMTLLEEICPSCQSPMTLRVGKNGTFKGCSAYPTCKYIQKEEPILIEGKFCPQCQSGLMQRKGRFGPFVGCSAYPTCTYIEKKSASTGVKCPVCQTSELMKRYDRRFKKYFYACGGYPECRYAVNHEPVAKSCAVCAWPLVLKMAKGLKCPQKECGHVSEP